MALFAARTDHLSEVLPTTLSEEGWGERTDLQRLLRDAPDALEAGLFILAEEYGDWQDSRRRIDLLALDNTGRLVVIELKRDDGGHMDLQALRYAAMVANMTFDQAVEAHRTYLDGRDISADPRERIVTHLAAQDDPEPDIDSSRPRILLVAGTFSQELTTSVLWLNDADLDVRCIRLQPYRVGDDLLLELSHVIPLPEAEDYMIRLRKKASESETRSYPDVEWTEDDLNRLAAVLTNPTLLAVLDLCAGSPNEWIPMSAVIGRSQQTAPQVRGAMGGFTTMIRGRFKRGNWPIDVEWSREGDEQSHYQMRSQFADWWSVARSAPEE